MDQVPADDERPSLNDGLGLRLGTIEAAVLGHERALRETGQFAPWGRKLCPLYTYAARQLAGKRGGRFNESHAAEELRFAAHRLALPSAPPYPPQPDPEDFGAFVRALLEDERAVGPDAAGFYALDMANLPR